MTQDRRIDGGLPLAATVLGTLFMPMLLAALLGWPAKPILASPSLDQALAKWIVDMRDPVLTGTGVLMVVVSLAYAAFFGLKAFKPLVLGSALPRGFYPATALFFLYVVAYLNLSSILFGLRSA